MLISLCRSKVLSYILLTFKLIRRGLLACLLATLLILTDRPFFVKGPFFPTGPFSLIDVSSCFAAYVLVSFFLLSCATEEMTNAFLTGSAITKKPLCEKKHIHTCGLQEKKRKDYANMVTPVHMN